MLYVYMYIYRFITIITREEGTIDLKGAGRRIGRGNNVFIF